jgi:NTE family protein
VVVQVTPARDVSVPLTPAAIDRQLDRIAANAVLNAEIAALQWTRANAAPIRLHRIAAEDEIEGLAQMSPLDLSRGFVTLLRERGYDAADRWLKRPSEPISPASRSAESETAAQSAHASIAEPALA